MQASFRGLCFSPQGIPVATREKPSCRAVIYFALVNILSLYCLSIVVYIFFLSISTRAMVVAFGNATSTYNSPIWHGEPNKRGSWSLLSSCVITIALCAWTALHLNVPEHGTADRQWLRKTKWLVLGLLAPEVVVYVAWRQRREAARVVSDVRACLGQKAARSRFRRIWDWCFGSKKASSGASPKIESTTQSLAAVILSRPEWTMVHGFYAVMGGFAFDTSISKQNFLPGSRTRAALTTTGLRFLLHHEPDLLPYISEEQIKDKSKADGLKKFLVCLQASWFCASCITRLANSLPISLLELNALGHAACALLIYGLWWHKPLDVDEPSLIQGGEKVEAIAAFMWMSSGVAAEGYKSYDLHGEFRDEFGALWMYGFPRLGDLVFDRGEAVGGTVEEQIRHTTSAYRRHLDKDSLGTGLDPRKHPMCGRHYASSSNTNMRYRIVTYLRSHPSISAFLRIRFPPGLGVRTTAIEHLSSATVTRWKLAHQAITTYNLEEDILRRQFTRSNLYDQDSRVKARIGNLIPLLGSRPHEVWLGFAVAGVLYGGLHMFAWDAPFESRAEKILWRVAASSVTVAPLLFAPVAILFGQTLLGKGAEDLVKMLREHKGRRKVRFWAAGALAVLLVPLFALTPFLWLSYVLGRVYLVVECFKNVAHLPEGVFEDVDWPSYLPHIN